MYGRTIESHCWEENRVGQFLEISFREKKSFFLSHSFVIAIVVVSVPPTASVEVVWVERVLVPLCGVKLINLRIVSLLTEMPNPAK